MILSSACQPQADPFPAPSGRHGERRSYTTPRDTIVPDGIFYANVSTQVVFFTKTNRPTEKIWIYDLRTNMPSFGKRNPLTRAHFSDFESAFGDDPDGKSPRTDEGLTGRFRCFDRAYFDQRDANLNITWLPQEKTTAASSAADLDDLIGEIRSLLDGAIEDVDLLAAALSQDNMA